MRSVIIFCIVCYLFNLFPNQIVAQKQGGALIDSLENSLLNLKDDTVRVKVLYYLSTSLYATNPDKGIDYANQVLVLSEKLKFKTGMALGNGGLGINYSLGKNNSELGLHYLLKSLQYNTENNDVKGIASSSANIANVYSMQGNFNSALEYYGVALKNHEQIGNKLGVANTLTNMANIYEDLQEYDKALVTHNNALVVFKELNRKDKEASVYSNFGNIYKEMKDHVKAKEYYNKALTLYIELNHKLGMSTIYTSMADLELDYNLAIHEYHKAYEIRSGLAGNKNLHYIHSGLASAYYNLAMAEKNNQLKIENLKLAKIYLDSSISSAQSAKLMPVLSKDYLLLSKIDSVLGDYKSALDHVIIANSFQDSIRNEKHFKKIHETQLEFEYQKKKMSLESERKLQEISAQKQLALKELDFEYKRKQALAKSEEEKEKLRYEEELKLSKINFDFQQKQLAMESEQQQKDLLQKSAQMQLDAQHKLEQLKNDEKAKQQRNALLGGFVMLSLVGIFFFFSNRQKQRLKRKQEMELIKQRISHDLHDDIGSTLNSISMFAEIAKRRAEKNEKNQELVDNISTISKEMMSRMGDIVWSLKAGNETVAKWQERLYNYCSQILTPLNISFSFKVQAELNEYVLNSEIIKEVYLIAKEAINNSMKYASCTHILIDLHKHEHTLILKLKDDGKGFDTSKVYQGLGGEGIKNMQSRAQNIGAEILIESFSGQGTLVQLVIPYRS
ncbi:MAG: tetratricopeptide repeat protein [Bacteroidetes bacterium]|nr:tetratricopeptide repeat protein [Bacteroidota bacterium]